MANEQSDQSKPEKDGEDPDARHRQEVARDDDTGVEPSHPPKHAIAAARGRDEAVEPATARSVRTSMIWSALLAVVGCIGTQLVTSYFVQRSARDTYLFQRRHEARFHAYQRLRGLAIPWSQAVGTWGDESVRYHYYVARFKRLPSHSPDDLEQARKRGDRAFVLLSTMAALEREVMEAVAEASVYYDLTPDFLEALKRLENASAFAPNPPPVGLRTDLELTHWEVVAREAVHKRALERFRVMAAGT